MSANQYVTDSVPFAGFLVYLFGAESLMCVSISEDRNRSGSNVSLTFHVPSEDAAEYFREFMADTLGVTSVLSFAKSQKFVTNKIKEATRNDGSWVSEYWVRGKTATGEKIE